MTPLRFDRPDLIVDEQIVRTLLYYDIFHYPLTTQEILRFLGLHQVDETAIVSRLDYLKQQNTVFQFDNFFTLHNDRAFVDRRIKGNKEAEKYLVLAQKKARFIGKFPFVRAVLASGSLSKGYMDNHSDLDFFVITAPGRLWIARTLLVMYKRLFLFNSHKYFCVNYFLDEDHLEIEEKNLFTATELATVIPLYGGEHYRNLHKANAWLTGFFPNYMPRRIADVPLSRTSLLKSFMEKLLAFVLGNGAECYFQKTTLSHWVKRYKKSYSSSDFKVAFKSTSYASKNHPRNYQKKIIDLYSEKLTRFGLSGETKSKLAVPPLKTETTFNSNCNA
jgi:hypothetical protein